MPHHAFPAREVLLAAWHLLRPPMLAFAVTMALRLAGLRGGRPALAVAAAGFGLLAGWIGLLGVPGSVHVLLASHALADRLRLAALGAALICLVAPLLPVRPPVPTALLALLGGWWMAGAPGRETELWRHAASLAVIAAALWIACRSMQDERVTLALTAGATLLLALAVAGAAPLWVMLALVPLACAVGWAPGPAPTGALLPVACGIVLAAVAIDQAAGGLARGRFGVMDAACLSPLVPILLLPRLERLGSLAAAATATAIGVGAVAIVARALAIL